MYTKTIFETAQEFFDAVEIARQKWGGTEPVMEATVPPDVYVVIEDRATLSLSGEGSEKFMLAESITWDDMIQAAFLKAGVRVHFT